MRGPFLDCLLRIGIQLNWFSILHIRLRITEQKLGDVIYRNKFIAATKMKVTSKIARLQMPSLASRRHDLRLQGDEAVRYRWNFSRRSEQADPLTQPQRRFRGYHLHFISRNKLALSAEACLPCGITELMLCLFGILCYSSLVYVGFTGAGE